MSSRSGNRAFRVGFIVGIAITVPATYLALTFNLVEDLLEFVVPASLLLRPLSAHFASWNGLASVSLAAVVNGVVYGAVAVAGDRLLRAARSWAST